MKFYPNRWILRKVARESKRAKKRGKKAESERGIFQRNEGKDYPRRIDLKLFRF